MVIAKRRFNITLGAVFIPVLLFMATHSAAKEYRIPAQADALVSSKNPNTNYGSNGYLWIGYDAATYGRLRSFIKFNVSSIPASEAQYITSVILKIRQSGSPTGKNYNIVYVVNDWNENTITWNDQPSAYVDEAQTTFPYQGWNEIQIDAPNYYTIKNWVSGATANYGWTIRAEDEYAAGVADLRGRESSYPESLIVITNPPTSVTFTVNSIPESGAYVFVNPSDLDGKSGGYPPVTFRFNQGASVRLTASNPALGRSFSAWWHECTLVTIQQWLDITANQGDIYYAEYTKDIPFLTATPGCGLITLSWSPATGAAGYRVYRDGVLLITVNSTTYTDNISGTHCYQVDAIFGCFNSSPKSNQACASSLNSPLPPTLSGPDSPVCANTQYCLTWAVSAGATSYETSENGDSWQDIGNVTQRCYAKSTPGDFTYQIRGKNQCGTGAASNSVIVSIKSVPPEPEKISPVITQVTNPVKFDWSYPNNQEIDLCKLLVYDENNEVKIERVVSGSSYTLEVELASNATYYWTVLAHNSCGWSPLNMTSLASFGVVTDIQLLEQPNLPTSFSINSIYPNPFNPETNIEFSVPTATHVILEIYNILGRRVNTLVDKELRAGVWNVTWDGRDYRGIPVSSGIYFCKIHADTFAESKKMLLLK